MTNTESNTSKRKYDELKINGPPLFKQGSIKSSFHSPQKSSFDSTFSSSSPNCIPPLDPSKTALLVVDVQPEYWSECPAVRADFGQFPHRISTLIHNCRANNVRRIIWVRADYSYEHSPWLHQFARLHQGRIPPVVRPSSQWEDFAAPLPNELVINKTSWSATTSGDRSLMDTLEADGINTVLVCGLITSVCVQHSAFGVFEAGYRTVLVTDACADRGKARHEAALALYGDYMYELRTVDSVREELLKNRTTVSGGDRGNAVSAGEDGDLSSFQLSSLFGNNNDDEEEEDCIGNTNNNNNEEVAEGGNNIMMRVMKKKKRVLVKSESDGSLTSATSHADSISSIDEETGGVEGGVDDDDE